MLADNRLLIFILLFTTFSILERFFPLNPNYKWSWPRWLSNVALSAFNSLAVVISPVTTIAVAYIAYFESYGLFNMLSIPYWIQFLLAVILLDFAIYLQHVLFHKVPFLWRLHRLHHADIQLDASSGIRFHTIEILLSIGFKCVLILLLGPPIQAVVAFEIILNGMALFNHANLDLPSWLDRLLRCCVVTPAMHVIHHSKDGQELNRNFGFNLSIWDRVFHTYQELPKNGKRLPELGLKSHPQNLSFFSMLVDPFKKSL